RVEVADRDRHAVHGYPFRVGGVPLEHDLRAGHRTNLRHHATSASQQSHIASHSWRVMQAQWLQRANPRLHSSSRTIPSSVRTVLRTPPATAPEPPYARRNAATGNPQPTPVRHAGHG